MEIKEEILDAIDRGTSPDLMSKRDAIEFIRDIIGDLEIRVEAMENEEDV